MKSPLGITSRAERRKHKPIVSTARRAGFTLLELSVVLIIIAILSALMASIGKEKISEARDIQTANKLDRIEAALQSFRLKNLRLPCPADRTLLPSDPNYGREAANAGRCTGGTPSVGASYVDAGKLVAEGGVPFATLGLSEEFAYDGWERKINYAVALRYTEIEAFEVYDIYEACSLITVDNAAGTTRSTKAAYVLESAGANGHGAFTKQGTRYSSGSTNANELINCKCTNGGVFSGPYTPTYVQDALFQAGNNSFDDLVRFKERWQLQSDDDRLILAYSGPETMLGIDQSPYVMFYTMGCDTYTAMSSPATVPSSAVLATSASPDNNYWTVGGAFTPKIMIYKRNSTTGALTKLADPASLPTTTVRGLSYSYNQDADFLAVAHDLDAAPSAVHLFQVVPATDTVSYLTGQPDVQPASNAKGIAFHPSGSYLTVLHTTAPYYMNIYSRKGTAFTHLTMATAMASPPGAQPVAVAFSPNGTYMALAESSSPYLEIYKVNLSAATFTKLAPPATMPGTTANAIAFDRKSRYLAVALSNGASSLYTYRVDPSTDTFTAIATANSSVGGLLSVAFSPRQNRWQDGEAGANSANSGKYIPGDEYFPLPMGTTLPSQPAGSHANAIAIRNGLLTHLDNFYIY